MIFKCIQNRIREKERSECVFLFSTPITTGKRQNTTISGIVSDTAGPLSGGVKQRSMWCSKKHGSVKNHAYKDIFSNSPFEGLFSYLSMGMKGEFFLM